MKPTIHHIAQASGVSIGTVSRVINGHGAVAEATRERVMRVMAHMGYRPDPAARDLSLRSKHSLGLSLARSDRRLAPYFVLFRQALLRALPRLGVVVEELEDPLETLPRMPSAVLVMGTHPHDPRLEFLRQQGVPTVMVGHHPHLPCVAPADEAGAALAAQHLLALGHRQLAFLSGEAWHQGALDRARGFRWALRTAQLELLAHLVSSVDLLGGYRAVRRAWESGLRFTALFCESDEMAVGAVAALEDLGVSVPQQVSVVGFDGMPELPYALTTVQQDIPAIAQGASGLIRDALQGEPPRTLLSPVHLLAGATTAPAP